jgi:hypothetical protein
MVLLLPGTAVLAKNMPNCAVKASAATDAEKNVARWQRSRALYLHDLEVSKLEQKSTSLSENEQDLIDKLTDADLYVAYAQANRLALNDTQKASNNIQEARDLLDQAHTLATGQEKERIAAVTKSLVSTEDRISACNGMNDNEERDAFEKLRKDIDSVVNDIGQA